MSSSRRWQDAQAYEREWWAGRAAEIASGKTGQLEWYRATAANVANRLRELGRGDLTDGSNRVLEIGAGPIGVATFYPAPDRTTVDPLEEFYCQIPALSALRDPAVKYTTGVGERLPAADGSIDLVISENCIDHTRSVEEVVREIVRVLRPGGMVYLTVNGRSRWGFLVHRVLSRLRIDAGHPHTFTAGKAEHLFDGQPMRVRSFSTDSFMRAWTADLKSSRNRDRLKGLAGVSEYVLTLYAERTEG